MNTEIENKTRNLGLIHIYTGAGKGKTTAAIGLAARALGSGLSVCYCSFHKDPEKYGYSEMESLRKLGAFVFNFAKHHPHMEENVTEDTIASITEEVTQALDTLKELQANIHFDLLIMDEILISIRDKYLHEDELIDFIKNKPVNTELVLTGIDVTERTLELADYITNMECVKHPYYDNIPSRKGIEY